MLTLTFLEQLLDFKNTLNRAQNPFFHKKVKSGRQVLEINFFKSRIIKLIHKSKS